MDLLAPLGALALFGVSILTAAALRFRKTVG